MRNCRALMPKRQSPYQHIPGLPFRRNWLHIPADFADYPIAIDAASYRGQVPNTAKEPAEIPCAPLVKSITEVSS
jgi:hypothetical protein